MQLDGVARAIHVEAGIRIEPPCAAAATGGTRHGFFQLQSDRGPVFLKVGPLTAADQFSAEADGLTALASAGTCTVPAVLALGGAGDRAFLLLEFLDLSGGATDLAAARLGQALALQHQMTQPAFGWHRDNWIGGSPQPNSPATDWCQFFADRRLGFQLNLAAHNGYRGDLQAKGRDLLAGLPALLADHRPAPALLHGDLWGGNWGANQAHQPCLFDPAVYRGDREADIAMTRLFGGFPPAFYHAYEAASPLPEGWQGRTDLYNLYHVLNHLNLFGSGYLRQAQRLMDRLVAQTP